MRDSLHRIRAIVRTELTIRLRRISTVVLLLGLCGLAYLIVPPASSDYALMTIGNQRALLNSAAISMATATLCATLMSLVGFYLVSNSVGRDVRTRTGGIIAATRVTNVEYIAGKFLGNVIYLMLVTTAFALCMMAMHLIRGEAPLQPLVYVVVFAVVVPTTIVFVSSIALVFENVRVLSGKAGDVVYFFVWAFALSMTAMQMENHVDHRVIALTDVNGLGMVVHSIAAETKTDTIGIGANTFDKTLSPIALQGMSSDNFIGVRLASLGIALPFLVLAWVAFPRFNPDKVRQRGTQTSWNLLALLNRWMRPLARVVGPLHALTPQSPFLRAVWLDVLLSMTLYPVTLVALAVVVVLSCVLPLAAVTLVILPIVFYTLVIVLADFSTRENTAGMTSLFKTVPRIREWFVAWKLAGAVLLSLCFTIAPGVRIAAGAESHIAALMTGTVFIAASATALGIISRTPKAFAVVFLLFLYMVVNARGEPLMDFVGWNGVVTPAVELGYVAVSLAMIIVTEAVYRWRLKRE